MRYLFFLVHPSKYYLFRDVINKLKKEGNEIDIVISSKGNLEELVKSEGWKCVNLFPKGRRIKGVHSLLSSAVFALITLFKLMKYAKRKRYDLFITDDLLTIAGRLLRVPAILCTDDDISAVPESVILISTANYILSPQAAAMKKYEKKKIGYYGYKALAHLHPGRFSPDRNKLIVPLRSGREYYLIRCVSVTSTHDAGKKGINNNLLRRITERLSETGRVIINSERSLPDEFNSYMIDINKKDIAHYLAFAKMFISDSTTMCAEAAVLGVPAVEIDDWFFNFGQYKELNQRYGLIEGFRPEEEERIMKRIDEYLKNKNLRAEYDLKRKNLLEDTIDVSAFIYWLLSEYPVSVEEYFKNKDVQLRFK